MTGYISPVHQQLGASAGKERRTLKRTRFRWRFCVNVASTLKRPPPLPSFKLMALQYGAKTHESLFVRVTARSTVARAYFVARFVLLFFAYFLSNNWLPSESRHYPRSTNTNGRIKCLLFVFIEIRTYNDLLLGLMLYGYCLRKHGTNVCCLLCANKFKWNRQINN